MNFLDYLDKLREKPDKIKFQIAVSISLAITIVIGGVWFISKSVDYGSFDNIVIKTEVESPISSLTATVSTSLETLSAEFIKLKEGLSNLFIESYKSEVLILEQNI